jgi:endo-1,4-beta-D-glucanase Y
MKLFSRYQYLFGGLAIAIAVAIAVVLIFLSSPQHTQTTAFSPTTLLQALWQDYKKLYVEEKTFRTVDHDRGDITTSEGQSYTMLRAVWLGDKATFDGAWLWTRTHLARPHDHLFSWLYGKHSDGSYGILVDQGGSNTASDGDSDIALALVMAYSRWQDPAYMAAARPIIQDLWNTEVVTIQGTTYLAANNLEKTSSDGKIIVNPSYLSPYAYRIFAVVDPTHPWNTLVDDSFTTIGTSMTSSLGSTGSALLPPDWVQINKKTGVMTAPASSSSLTTNFGYDALRTPWRLALDYQWNHDSRDTDLLRRMSFLSNAYATDGKLMAAYAHDGSVITTATGIQKTKPFEYESPSLYGGTIGYFSTVDSPRAARIYQDKLLYLFNADTNDWKETLSYYDSNWAWFGIALYNNYLPNLFETLPIKAYQQTTP